MTTYATIEEYIMYMFIGLLFVVVSLLLMAVLDALFNSKIE